MAGLEVRNGRYNLILRFGGKRFVRSLKTSDEDEATSKRLRVEENIKLVESGRLTIPDNSDVVTFLLSDGKLDRKPVVKGSLTIPQLFKEFWEALPVDSLEGSTMDMMKIHQRHVESVLGRRLIAQDLTHDDLQKYVTKRAAVKTYKGTTISGGTIKKEIVTFNSVWRWGVNTGKLHGEFPKSNLRYPKSKELPVFQTWQEIERQVAAGASAGIWDALYLSLDEITHLLDHVKEIANLPFLYPMFTFAAYTGARRSELLRSQLSDINLQGGVITIREKKRVKGKTSTRRVPLATPLKAVLTNWLSEHPGSPFTFCHPDPILGSHRKTRDDENQLTRDQASHHFKQVLQNSPWSVIKGWHCLRHSFISNCASKGIDQRMIDEWVGHSTEAMRRRYRHLFPASQSQAMKSLFA
ncbi:site-specific tyrosine recombinase XerC [Roseimaritima multifibrata]|uniref:Site-specific tyrosine recombinase XerC n=1 Tax=Roseimaritima multifibrata TaxID=1930274 RepID=A0A517M9A1_9BACT|nr:site-specific integrase [Roseimaritima multifibrata]QDS91401.1 site-specific tyrosine recombinase XerC [Roseimaritima multifibrata]